MKIGPSFLTQLRDAVFRPILGDVNRPTANVSAPKAVQATPLPGGKPDLSYDGALLGANGEAFPANTPISALPAVLPRSGTAGKETVIFVNGVGESKAGMSGAMQAIADKTGEPVVGVYNATEGMVKDYLQTIEGRFDLGKNPAVDSLADILYSKLKSNQPVRIAGYSQGGLICSRAIEDAKNRLQLEDGLSAAQVKGRLGLITCETFASAASSYPDGPKYVEYINRLDPVQLFSFRAFGEDPPNILVHQGEGAITHAFNSFGWKAHDLGTYLKHYVPFQDGQPA
jgi:hypothetical protein